MPETLRLRPVHRMSYWVSISNALILKLMTWDIHNGLVESISHPPPTARKRPQLASQPSFLPGLGSARRERPFYFENRCQHGQ